MIFKRKDSENAAQIKVSVDSMGGFEIDDYFKLLEKHIKNFVKDGVSEIVVSIKIEPKE